jgi:hypothetical protein
MGERCARSNGTGRRTNLNVSCSWRIGMAAMSLGWPLMLVALTGRDALAQEAAPPRVLVLTDRTVLPIPEPQYPLSTVFDARNATPPPRFEVKAAPNAAMAQEHPAHEWGYSGSEGPAHWGELTSEFATCKTGHRQSPVDIVGAQSADLPAIQFEYKPSALHIINNGHTIQIDCARGSFIRVGDKRYELKQFHFHHPSEETIKGKRFPMEVHLVHLDADGNLAVVSVLLEEGSANPLV